MTNFFEFLSLLIWQFPMNQKSEQTSGAKSVFQVFSMPWRPARLLFEYCDKSDRNNTIVVAAVVSCAGQSDRHEVSTAKREAQGSAG
ncbi:hypothetical protein [Sphingomonas sp. SORGH_AS_0879]|uniref:hypothetical protein n=1 Tax=Sphingomonas sp. SORGH_AS_0879 TaxID=3041790 RepID=UPI00278575AA|nr:hypothetical protein [Sphingomonas sp. SORGH_AS_0879]MDQ1231673.1 hypothetical protein [Sphingomonas sp. SORGH_AS_0879]